MTLKKSLEQSPVRTCKADGINIQIARAIMSAAYLVILWNDSSKKRKEKKAIDSIFKS